jgi:hypothetical protein
MQKLLLKSLFVLISSITTLTTTAQEQRMEFGVQAGLNLSDGVEKADYILGAQTIKPGFQAGVTAAYKVYKGLQLQSGLSLTTKGVKHTANEVWIGSTNPAVTTTKTATNLIYLQLPLKIAYRLNLSENFTLTPNAGIYLAYGVGGKQTEKSTTTHEAVADTKTKKNSFSDKEGFKRMDNGINFGAAIQYKRYTLAADYELGVNNIGRNPANTTNTYQFRNRNIGITVGYIL